MHRATLAALLFCSLAEARDVVVTREDAAGLRFRATADAVGVHAVLSSADGSTISTLLALIGISLFSRPPCGFFWLRRTCFQTRPAPSTTTFFFLRSIFRILPRWPLSAPAITSTSSSTRNNMVFND